MRERGRAARWKCNATGMQGRARVRIGGFGEGEIPLDLLAPKRITLPFLPARVPTRSWKSRRCRHPVVVDTPRPGHWFFPPKLAADPKRSLAPGARAARCNLNVAANSASPFPLAPRGSIQPTVNRGECARRAPFFVHVPTSAGEPRYLLARVQSDKSRATINSISQISSFFEIFRSLMENCRDGVAWKLIYNTLFWFTIPFRIVKLCT